MAQKKRKEIDEGKDKVKKTKKGKGNRWPKG